MRKLIIFMCVAATSIVYLLADRQSSVSDVILLENKQLQSMTDVKQISNTSVSSQSLMPLITINSQKINEDYYRILNLNETLKKDIEEGEIKLRLEATKYQEIAKGYQKDMDDSTSPALTEEAKKNAKDRADGKLRELVLMENELHFLKDSLENGIKQKREKEGAEIAEKIRKVVEEIAKKKDCLIVLDSKGPGVFYVAESLDITNSVIDKLNADKPKPILQMGIEANSSATSINAAVEQSNTAKPVYGGTAVAIPEK